MSHLDAGPSDQLPDATSPAASELVTDQDVETHDWPAGEGPLHRLRLHEQLCFALYSATNAITRTYRPLLRRIGLTYPQYLAMVALWEDADTTPTRLAARLDLPAHGLSPVLERLEHQGLVERRRDPADRRSIRITLTAAGRALEADAARAQEQVVCRTQLAGDVLDQLRDDLHHLTSTLIATRPAAPTNDRGPRPA